MSRNDIRIGNNHLACSGIEKQEQKVNSDRAIVRTLSPVTCYNSSEKTEDSTRSILLLMMTDL